MTAKIDAFLSEVRNMPEFAAAIAAGRIRDDDGLERALSAVGRRADEDPAVVDIYDEIQVTIGRRDLAMKAKLTALGKLFLRALDTTKKVH
jgi:hypothetical protein